MCRVLKVSASGFYGWLKEKVLGAHRSGIRTIIMPKDNMKDLEEIPDHVRKEMAFKPVEYVDEVLNIALLPAVKTIAA